MNETNTTKRISPEFKYGSRYGVLKDINASYKHVVSKKSGIDYLYLICPTCSRVLNQRDNYCRECGHRLRRYTDGTGSTEEM